MPIVLSGRHESVRTIIGRDAWVGHRVVIMSGVNTGDRAMIAEESVVTKKFPPFLFW